MMKGQTDTTARHHLRKGGRRRLLLLLLIASLGTASAQDDTEYRMEIGGGLGLTAYEGDLNGSLLKGMKPTAALTAKYKMNPRMAWTAMVGLGRLKGASDGVKTWYPGLRDSPVEFSTSLTDITVRYEYNFWPFGTGKEYLGAKPLTPFIALGAGLAFANPKLKGAATSGKPGSATAFQVPLGLGVKYKVADRLNLTAEWTMHFTGSDKLDGVADPYGIKSDGLFKNTDCYSTLLVSLTYDVWAKCKTCHNDRE